MDINYGTHQAVLLEMIKVTDKKSILELGAGEFSTRQIHDVAKDRKIVTVDYFQEWLDKYLDLSSNTHTFILVNSTEVQNFYNQDNENWGVVFVDGIDWNDRVLAINKYKETADYLVIHDIEYPVGQGLFGTVVDGKRCYDDVFKYWIEFLPINWEEKGLTAHVLLASNYFNLLDIMIPGMVVTSRNIIFK